MSDARARSTWERRGLGAVALALLLTAMAPVWASRYLPLLDEPNHLSAIAIWRGLWDHVPSVEAFYELRIAPVSYLAHYGLAFILLRRIQKDDSPSATEAVAPPTGVADCELAGRG